MCGIVGIVSKKNCIKEIISGLKALEYRGYDSSGLAFFKNNKLTCEKSIGKISNLIKKIKNKKIKTNTAIAHTRWATHGKPNNLNAHPFIKDNCAIVHNGIIENYDELIKLYSLNKKNIISDTDTEIIAELYNQLLNNSNNPLEELIKILKKIKGTYAFAFLVSKKNSILAARKGSPLVLGLGDSFNSISSDVLGLPGNTKEIIFLEENDIAEITDSNIKIYNNRGKEVSRKKQKYINKNTFTTKDKYNHFMQKEIFYQPISIEDTLLNFTDKKSSSILLPKSNVNLNKISNLYFVACGTAYHACMIAKYWMDNFTSINSIIDIGSEYRYRKDFLNKDSIGIVISQSGETMDTLECLKKFKENNLYTVSIINVINSSISRLSDYVLPTLAGPEIGVASTKAFTAQLSVLALLTLHIQQKKDKNYNEILASLFKLKKSLDKILEDTKAIKSVARSLKNAKSIFYVGRGVMYPLALEGALKLKEITYKHCEGYAAGELKHGPLALIEKNIPVIVLAPYDKNFSKLLSNIQEIKARDGKIIAITDKVGQNKIKKYSDKIIILPESNIITSPIIYSLPIQLIAYYLAVLLKKDIDQPRNLAKSVTVE